MKIPVFKPSKTFVHDYKVPCLVAKLKNSQVTGIGELHRKETKKNPVWQVFLRGTNAREISPWQQQMLKRLFEQDELVSAVATGMKDYEKSTGYGDPDAIQSEGILPHLYLTGVIIDERQQEVIICAHTLADLSLDEHGIAISLKKGRWKFGSLDYLNDYLRNLDFNEPTVPGKRGSAPSVRDLYGTWVLDEAATAKLLTMRGMKSYVNSTLKEFRGTFFEVSKGHIRNFSHGQLTKGKIIKCEWSGNAAWLTYRVPGERYAGTWGGKLQNNQLVEDEVVFRRLAPGEAAPASPWVEMDPRPLLGVWENKGGNDTSMTFILEITRDKVLQQMKVMGMARAMEFRWSRCVTNGSSIRLDTQSNSTSGKSSYPITLQLKEDKLRWGTWTLKRKHTPKR